MSEFKKLSHTVYQCNYHVVFCPKYRYRILNGNVAAYVQQQLFQLARQKDELEILELSIQLDHVHMLISIPPKYAVSSVMGFLKGKVAIRLFRHFEHLGHRHWGRKLWSRGYCVSSVGLNEDQIRRYIQWQEKRDRHQDSSQGDLFDQ